MLSTRGQEYAQSGFMSGYMRAGEEPFNKATNPEGEVSFANAENVCSKDRPMSPKLSF